MKEDHGVIKAHSFIPTVIGKVAGVERAYDIYSRLLTDRIIFVGGYEGEFTTESANSLIAQMLYLDSQDDSKDICLYINSPGGMVTAGLAVYDAMQFIKSPISTVCMGMAMSFGAVILAAGTKGKRFALPNSRIMIHQPLIMGGGISGQATDIEIESKEMQLNKKVLTEIMAKHCGQTFEKVQKDMERNLYMSAEEAKAYGLIDAVLPFRKK
ncbi:MAG: ATP-dependent Clp protease proteolytic subunit [Patescibacteria group bacterium]|nr:ATP-dependent Clp protease proteolytic subunit [Patescibacteria group bacterium]